MVEATNVMTIEQFIHMYDQEGPFELVNGERVILSPTVARHNLIIKTLFIALHNYVESQGLGQVFSELPFILSERLDWVKGSHTPDVMFVLAKRWTGYKQDTPDWVDKPLILVPDLVAEVVSPTDRYSDIQQKVDGYLQDGVQVVWVIDPKRESVTVYKPDLFYTLSGDSDLSGDQLLPDFALSLKTLFATS